MSLSSSLVALLCLLGSAAGLIGDSAQIPTAASAPPAEQLHGCATTCCSDGASTPEACYDPDNYPNLELFSQWEVALRGHQPRYNQNVRWPNADGTAGTRGVPRELTWSFVPDGLEIPASGTFRDGAANSDLFVTMDGLYGANNRAVWIAQFQSVFDRYSALTGIRFRRVTAPNVEWDDNADWGMPGGATRGDIRIAGKNFGIEDAVLAYAGPPPQGDIVLDTNAPRDWNRGAPSYVFLRNTFAHEIGHALGLRHVCASYNSRLMEPRVTTLFDGPQHDDIRGIANFYGDYYETDAAGTAPRNNSAANAVNLGPLSVPQELTPSTIPLPGVDRGSRTGIDVPGDEDWFKVTLTGPARISVYLTPVGFNYDNSMEQPGPMPGMPPYGVCGDARNYFDSARVAALAVEVREGANGNVVSGAAGATCAGDTVDLGDVPLASGTVWIRVHATQHNLQQSQMYSLRIVARTELPDPIVPGNNTCDIATLLDIRDGTWYGNLAGATNDGSATCGLSDNSPDVWFRYIAEQSGTLVVHTCGSDYDTVLSVHSGCPGTNANQLQCNDDAAQGPCAGTTRSYLTVPVVRNTAYRIRVAGFNGATGNYQLTTSLCTPSNDSCAGAIPIGNGVFTGDTTGYLVDGSSTCDGPDTGPDVWFRYTATCDGVLQANTCGSSFITTLAAFDACPGTLGVQQIRCGINSAVGVCTGPTRPTIAFRVRSGRDYYLRLAGRNGASGAYQLTTSCVVDNDNCANAITVTAPSTTYFAGFVATVDGNASCQSAAPDDVWYRFVAPCNATARFDTCGWPQGAIYHSMSVHSACPGTVNNELACAEALGPSNTCPGSPRIAVISMPVTRNTEYFIRLAGNGLMNEAVLNVSLSAPANDNCNGATPAVVGANSFAIDCGATPQGTASCGDSNATPDVWFSYAATCNGNLIIDTCGAGYDTVLSVYTGACAQRVEVACNDDAVDGACAKTLQSSIQTPITNGTTYLIRISGFNGLVGSGNLNLAACANACACDWNQDSVLNAQDYFDFLTNFFAENADYNNNGETTSQDYFDFLLCFFSQPGGC